MEFLTASDNETHQYYSNENPYLLSINNQGFTPNLPSNSPIIALNSIKLRILTKCSHFFWNPIDFNIVLSFNILLTGYSNFLRDSLWIYDCILNEMHEDGVPILSSSRSADKNNSLRFLLQNQLSICRQKHKNVLHWYYSLFQKGIFIVKNHSILPFTLSTKRDNTLIANDQIYSLGSSEYIVFSLKNDRNFLLHNTLAMDSNIHYTEKCCQDFNLYVIYKTHHLGITTFNIYQTCILYNMSSVHLDVQICWSKYKTFRKILSPNEEISFPHTNSNISFTLMVKPSGNEKFHWSSSYDFKNYPYILECTSMHRDSYLCMVNCIPSNTSGFSVWVISDPMIFHNDLLKKIECTISDHQNSLWRNSVNIFESSLCTNINWMKPFLLKLKTISDSEIELNLKCSVVWDHEIISDSLVKLEIVPIDSTKTSLVKYNDNSFTERIYTRIQNHYESKLKENSLTIQPSKSMMIVSTYKIHLTNSELNVEDYMITFLFDQFHFYIIIYSFYWIDNFTLESFFYKPYVDDENNNLFQDVRHIPSQINSQSLYDPFPSTVKVSNSFSNNTLQKSQLKPPVSFNTFHNSFYLISKSYGISSQIVLPRDTYSSDSVCTFWEDHMFLDTIPLNYYHHFKALYPYELLKLNKIKVYTLKFYRSPRQSFLCYILFYNLYLVKSICIVFCPHYVLYNCNPYNLSIRFPNQSNEYFNFAKDTIFPCSLNSQFQICLHTYTSKRKCSLPWTRSYDLKEDANSYHHIAVDSSYFTNCKQLTDHWNIQQYNHFLLYIEFSEKEALGLYKIYIFLYTQILEIPKFYPMLPLPNIFFYNDLCIPLWLTNDSIGTNIFISNNSFIFSFFKTSKNTLVELYYNNIFSLCRFSPTSEISHIHSHHNGRDTYKLYPHPKFPANMSTSKRLLKIQFDDIDFDFCKNQKNIFFTLYLALIPDHHIESSHLSNNGMDISGIPNEFEPVVMIYHCQLSIYEINNVYYINVKGSYNFFKVYSLTLSSICQNQDLLSFHMFSSNYYIDIYHCPNHTQLLLQLVENMKEECTQCTHFYNDFVLSNNTTILNRILQFVSSIQNVTLHINIPSMDCEWITFENEKCLNVNNNVYKNRISNTRYLSPPDYHHHQSLACHVDNISLSIQSSGRACNLNLFKYNLNTILYHYSNYPLIYLESCIEDIHIKYKYSHLNCYPNIYKTYKSKKSRKYSLNASVLKLDSDPNLNLYFDVDRVSSHCSPATSDCLVYRYLLISNSVFMRKCSYEYTTQLTTEEQMKNNKCLIFNTESNDMNKASRQLIDSYTCIDQCPLTPSQFKTINKSQTIRIACVLNTLFIDLAIHLLNNHRQITRTQKYSYNEFFKTSGFLSFLFLQFNIVDIPSISLQISPISLQLNSHQILKTFQDIEALLMQCTKPQCLYSSSTFMEVLENQLCVIRLMNHNSIHQMYTLEPSSHIINSRQNEFTFSIKYSTIWISDMAISCDIIYSKYFKFKSILFSLPNRLIRGCKILPINEIKLYIKKYIISHVIKQWYNILSSLEVLGYSHNSLNKMYNSVKKKSVNFFGKLFHTIGL